MRTVEVKIVLDDGRAATITRKRLQGGAIDIAAVKRNGETISVSSSICHTNDESVEKIIEVAGNFLRESLRTPTSGAKEER